MRLPHRAFARLGNVVTELCVPAGDDGLLGMLKRAADAALHGGAITAAEALDEIPPPHEGPR